MRGRWHFAALSAIAGTALASAGFDWRFSLSFAAFFLFAALIRKWLLAAVCSSIFLLAFLSFLHVNDANKTTLASGTNQLVGKISSMPALDGDHLSFQMKVEEGETVMVNTYLKERQQIPQAENLRFGMSCSLDGKLQKPALPRNFHAFNYRKYLFRQHIHWQFTVITFSASSCQRGSYSILDHLQQWRGYGVRWISSHFPVPVRGISEALVFGWRNDVSPDILQAYRDLGIIHLLAVSGLHVGLVMGALYYCFIRFGFTKERSLEFLLVILPLYVLMTGASPSVSRSGLMGFIALLAARLGKKIHPLDGISWVGIVLIAFNPYIIFQTGFQLSFLVSFTLIASAPAIQKRYHSRFAQLLAVSVISQMVSMPLLLYNFYGISLFSLPFNLVFIPFISFLILPLAIISFFASLLAPFLASPLLSLLSFSVKNAHELLLAADRHFSGMLLFGKPSLPLVFLMYGSVFYGLVKWEKGNGPRRLILPVLFLGGLCLFQWLSPYLSNEGEVTLLDVGQGDGILIQLPHRRAVYLIDTGGTIHFGQQDWQKRKHEFLVGRDVVLQELKSRGIRKIDKLILTHGDMDHIGGTKSLFGRIRIGEMMYGKGRITKPLPKELIKKAEELHIKVVRLARGMSWKSGEDAFAVLNPDGTEQGNDRSVVIAAQIDGIKWLFTGDLEKEGEARLLSEYPNLKIDILKVGHHGSNTSTTQAWIQALKPKAALISVGKHNFYHQPSPDVIDRLQENHVQIYRTDQMGSVVFRFDGNKRSFDWMIKPH